MELKLVSLVIEASGLELKYIGVWPWRGLESLKQSLEVFGIRFHCEFSDP